jgi:hypothetical protein
MKKYTYSLTLFFLCSCVLQAEPTVLSDILPPQKRVASVELALRLAKSADADAVQLPEDIKNPFNPSAGVPVEMKSGRPSSDKDLLSILADQLRPTGVMGREDSLVLLLKGQKSVKVNDKLTLSFDGTAYEVEVISIDRTSFALRYNQAEITRPIKTGKNP